MRFHVTRAVFFTAPHPDVPPCQGAIYTGQGWVLDINEIRDLLDLSLESGPLLLLGDKIEIQEAGEE